MSTKHKVHLQYSDDLEAVDAALSEAMTALDEKNERVAGLLLSIEPPKESAAPSAGPEPEPQSDPVPEPENA